MIEEHGRDGQRLRVELVEDVMRVVCAVVVADPRVIAPDYEMRAAVILSDDGVKDGLARPGGSHRRRVDGQ